MAKIRMNHKLPGVIDVARLAGVSIGTVSNVINRPSTVSEPTLRKVQSAIAELGYVRNEAARQLRAGTSNAIGLIVQDFQNPFYSSIAKGAEDHSYEKGFTILLGSSNYDLARERSYLALFEEQRIHGIVLSPSVGSDLEQLAERGVPIVLFDTDLRGEQFFSVNSDNVEGGRLAARHLLERGKSRMAFIGSGPSFHQAQDRLRGFVEVARGSGGSTVQHVLVSGHTFETGLEAGRALLAAPEMPDGIFTENDLIALGLMQAVIEDGRHAIPEDIAIVGYDDIDFARIATIPLTSIRQSPYAMGKSAIEMLVGELRGGGPNERRDRVFVPQLVTRLSSVRGVT